MQKRNYRHFKRGMDNIRLLKLNRSISPFVVIVMAPLILVACGAFRLHDAGRLETSREALKLSAELSIGGVAVFEPMEQNLDAVRSTQEKLRELTNKHELETFKIIVASMKADDIAKELVEVMNDRIELFESIEESQRNIAITINNGLDRQTSLKKFLNETIKDKTNLEEALKRVKARLVWVEKIVDNAAKLRDKLDKESKNDKNKKNGKERKTVEESLTALKDTTIKNGGENKDKGNEKIIRDLFSKAEAALKEVEDDKRVDAATKLILQLSQEIASIEQSRLIEMKRYLGEILRIKDSIIVRDKISVCELFVPALGKLYPVLRNEIDEEETDNEEIVTKVDIENLVGKLKNSGRYNCLPIFKGPGAFEFDPNIQDLWQHEEGEEVKGNTLAQYVVEDLDKNKSNGKSPELVAGLGILLFYERQLFDDARWLLARESHRHSIRISKINAQQRASLVNQLAQGLEIYYQGGIKPEEVANIALLAGQVGALGFIGTQVD